MSDEIRTERLCLRRLEAGDAAPITEAVQDPRIYEKVARIAPGQTVDITRGWMRSVAEGEGRDTDHVFVIEEQGVMAGVVGGHRKSTAEPFEIGYWLVPAAWGRGIATAAGKALIDWLDETGRGGRLTSGHFKDNPASGRVLQKLGFRPDHEAPVFCLGRGRDIDHVFMVREPEAR